MPRTQNYGQAHQRLFFIVPVALIVLGGVFISPLAPPFIILIPITIILLPLAFSEYPLLSWVATSEWLMTVRIGWRLLKKRGHDTPAGLKAAFLDIFEAQKRSTQQFDERLARDFGRHHVPIKRPRFETVLDDIFIDLYGQEQIDPTPPERPKWNWKPEQFTDWNYRRTRWWKTTVYTMDLAFKYREVRDKVSDLLQKHVPQCYEEEGTLETTLLDALLDKRRFMHELIQLFQDDTPQSLFRNLRRQFYALSSLVGDKYKRGKTPLAHPKHDIEVVAYDFFRNTSFEKLFATKLYLHIPWVEKHGIIVAPPGSGKSQLIETMAWDWIHDVKEQPTLVIIDSKEDGLVDRISRLEIFHPDHGEHFHRLTIIDPEDTPAMGVFAKGSTILNNLLKGWPGVGGFTTIQEGIVNNLVPLISAMEGTIEDAIEALQHPRQEKFQAVLPTLQESVRNFWEKYQPRDNGPSLPGIIGRLQAIISIPHIGQMFNARENRFDMFKEMDAGHIILVRTSKGLLGIERSNALAKFFISQVFSAATKRTKYKHETYLIVDEAVNLIDKVTGESYETLRSYNVHCLYATVSAHQLGSYWYSTGQLSDVRFAAALEGTEANLVQQFMGKDCTVDFLFAQQKENRDDGKRSDWIKVGCYIKGIMGADPVSLKIKTGLLDAQGFMIPVAYKKLRQLNKERLCVEILDELDEFHAPEHMQSNKPGRKKTSTSRDPRHDPTAPDPSY